MLVVEHNLDVVKTADWIIDLGPEGGDGGGQIVVAGTPEQVAQCGASYTGQALAERAAARRRPSGRSRSPRKRPAAKPRSAPEGSVPRR